MTLSYYRLTKPGIVKGNLYTAAAGFFLASYGRIDPVLFLSAIIGTAFVIASGGVFNNIIDRGIDRKMLRTNKRELVVGKIKLKNAFVYGALLFFAGMVFLFYSSTTAVLTALVGFVFYVFVYGYFKRRSVYGTLIGSISGATPPVIGYTAVTNGIDLGAILLFLILVFWQMPHFYAIGIYRKKEYEKAGLPLLPIVKGIESAKLHIFWYALGFTFFTALLTFFGYTGLIYLFIMLAVSTVWLIKIVKGLGAKNHDIWAKGVFSYSLFVLVVFSFLISLDFVFPL